MPSTIFERNELGRIVPQKVPRVRIYLGEKEIWRTYGRRKQMIGKEPIYELCDLLDSGQITIIV